MGSYLSRQICSVQHALSCIGKLPNETIINKTTDNITTPPKVVIDINEYTELFKELR